MLGPILLITGVVMMATGLASLGSWVSGGRSCSGAPRAPARVHRIESMLMWLHFIALVLTPLLVGAILIAVGLQKLM